VNNNPPQRAQADGNASLKTRPLMRSGLEGLGHFPTSNFHGKFVIGKPITLLATEH